VLKENRIRLKVICVSTLKYIIKICLTWEKDEESVNYSDNHFIFGFVDVVVVIFAA
jgi:hypothetical protein